MVVWWNLNIFNNFLTRQLFYYYVAGQFELWFLEHNQRTNRMSRKCIILMKNKLAIHEEQYYFL